MKRAGKNLIAAGLAMLLITGAFAFSAQADDKTVAQGSASAIQGTGLFEILDGGTCTAVSSGNDATPPTGRCGSGLNTNSIDAYSQTAKAGVDDKNNGVSSAHATVAPINALDLHTTLDLTELIDGLAAIDTGSILDPIVGGLGGLLKTVIDTLKLAGIDLVGTIDSTLQTVLKGLDSALPVKLQVGAVEASASAKPGYAEGTSTVAGLNLLIELGGQQVKVPLTADTSPNSNLLIGSPQQLVDDIIEGLKDTLTASLGGALAALNPVLDALKDQLLGPLFDALEPTLLKGLADALAPIISGTVNVQDPVSPTDGEITVTALHLEVLGADNTLNLARVHVGPNSVFDDNADVNADVNADAVADADTGQTNADVNADANANATPNLPNTGGSTVLPLAMLALLVTALGGGMVLNGDKRSIV